MIGRRQLAQVPDTLFVHYERTSCLMHFSSLVSWFGSAYGPMWTLLNNIFSSFDIQYHVMCNIVRGPNPVLTVI